MDDENVEERYFEKIAQALRENQLTDLDAYFDKDQPQQKDNPEDFSKMRESKTVLGSLDWKNWLLECPIPITSHYTNSLEALQKTALTRVTIVVIARASRLPDFLDFDTPAAHAQCSNDEEGLLQHVEADKEKFIAWIAQHLQNIKSYVSQANIPEVMFELGYILHGIQDLAVHQGQSNAEHSYNNRVHKSPDEDVELAKFAAQISQSFIEQYVLRKLDLLPLDFIHQMNGSQIDTNWISKLTSQKLQEAGQGYWKFRKSYKRYEHHLNQGTDVSRLDARWLPFSQNTIPQVQDICQCFFDPIAELFYSLKG